jgi:hypothetical protein
LKPLPKGRIEELLVTKQSAAISQLNTAIWLWFNDGDPVSIHALAVASHECLNGLLRHATGKESDLWQWIEEQSESRKKRILATQNFFKHGSNQKAKILLATIDAEVFMMAAVKCCEALGKHRSALIQLFAHRFLYEHPALMTDEALPIFAKNAEVHQLADTTREEFFQRVFPIFTERFGAVTRY